MTQIRLTIIRNDLDESPELIGLQHLRDGKLHHDTEPAAMGWLSGTCTRYGYYRHGNLTQPAVYSPEYQRYITQRVTDVIRQRLRGYIGI